MAIILPSGFIITNNEPADSRFSVADSAARLALSVNNVYEGLTVYQRDTNSFYLLIDASNPANESNWKIISYSSTGNLNYIATGSITASVDITDNIFLITSGSQQPFKISSEGSVQISGSALNLFLITNNVGVEVLKVSQSGIIIMSTQSVELAGAAPVGGIYFTSGSMYVGLES